MKLERIYDPLENEVHYKSVGIQDAVTLCYQTDWTDQEQGMDTDKPVTCKDCREIVKAIQSARKERF